MYFSNWVGALQTLKEGLTITLEKQNTELDNSLN